MELASTPLKPKTETSDGKRHLCESSLPSSTRSTGTPELAMAYSCNQRPLSTGRSQGMRRDDTQKKFKKSLDELLDEWASTPVKPRTETTSDGKHHLETSVGKHHLMESSLHSSTRELFRIMFQTPTQMSASLDANSVGSGSNSITSLPLRLSTPMGEKAQVKQRDKEIATRKLLLSSEVVGEGTQKCR